MITDKKQTPEPKKDANAGSTGFNQGSAQDPDYDKGTPVSDEEKLTGHSQSPGAEKKDKSPDETEGEQNVSA